MMKPIQRQIQLTFASIAFILFALALMLYLVAMSAVGTTARYYISGDDPDHNTARYYISGENDKAVARYYISDEQPERYYIS